MALRSDLFRDCPELQECLVRDAAHVTKGSVGNHVHLIQAALVALDGADIDLAEWNEQRYGETTADAVLAYKTRREIINRSYQSKPDNIVGKMTIASLDEEVWTRQHTPLAQSFGCWRR